MSEIFDEYAKIAKEQGLIKEAEEKTNPRYDSFDLSAIEALYGVQPNGKEEDIIEEAHPESPVVVAPAYDRLNGLVENVRERQDAIADIALAPNDGKLIQRRYVKANHDLVNEVVKIAFMMDRKDESELMSLADDCAGRLTKQSGILAGIWGATKLISLILGGATVGSGIVGIFANHSAVIGIKQNAQKALDEINDMLSETGEWYEGGGANYSVLADDLQPLIKYLNILIKASELMESVDAIPTDQVDIENLTAGEAKEGLEKAKENVKNLYKQKAFRIAKIYSKICDMMLKIIPRYVKFLKRKEKELAPASSTVTKWFGDVKEWLSWQTDLEDVTDELEAVHEAIVENKQNISQIKEGINEFSNEDETIAKMDELAESLENEELDTGEENAVPKMEDLSKELEALKGE